MAMLNNQMVIIFYHIHRSHGARWIHRWRQGLTSSARVQRAMRSRGEKKPQLLTRKTLVIHGNPMYPLVN